MCLLRGKISLVNKLFFFTVPFLQAEKCALVTGWSCGVGLPATMFENEPTNRLGNVSDVSAGSAIVFESSVGKLVSANSAAMYN